MPVHPALDEEAALLRVEPARHVLGGAIVHVFAKLRGDIRNGHGVHVRYAEIAFVVFGHFGPVLHRAEIIAEMQPAGRLRGGEHHFFILRFFVHLRDAIFAPAGVSGNTKNRSGRKKNAGDSSVPRAGFQRESSVRPAPRKRSGQRPALPRSAKTSANAPSAAANAAGSGTVSTSMPPAAPSHS